MTTSPLVSTQWMADHLNDPNVRIIEVSALNNSSNYRQGHLPGALWFYWKDFCWHSSDREFLTPKEMAERLGNIGVGPGTTLVLYGDPVQFGTYAYWALKMAGHKNLRLLDGTRTKWSKERRPLTANIARFTPVDYPVPAPDASSRLGRDAVRAKLGKVGVVILDARSPEEYLGERVSPATNSVDHGAERKGRIPGAKHLFYKSFLNEDDSFKSPAEMRAAIAASGIDAEAAKEVVCYCRLSHRATLVWTAMGGVLDLGNVKIYDGSWTEWGSVVGFPVER